MATERISNDISVSFGADITTWAYINYIQKHNYLGGISQPCLAVVGYIERYLPELLPKLFPVQSPMMCSAIYARKELGVTERIQSLAASTEEISASTTIVSDTVEQVKNELEQLVNDSQEEA